MRLTRLPTGAATALAALAMTLPTWAADATGTPAAPATFDAGDTAWVLVSTALVMLMTPGLAFFYGGLVGRKNVLAIMIQSFVSMGWTTVIWWLCGFSLCFSGSLKGGTDFYGIVGNLDWAFLRGLSLDTASPNDTIPMIVFCAYQMMFEIGRAHV